ncbi:MAG: hypothetical protein WBQ34_08150 [Candidatus Acidiferrales bacterium]
MTCPHCDDSVPMMALWQATGLSGVVCPHCDSSLQPVYWRSVVLLFLAGLAGYFEGSLLRASGYATAIWLLGVTVTVFLVYAALAPFLLRLRVKEDGTVLLPHSNS